MPRAAQTSATGQSSKPKKSKAHKRAAEEDELGDVPAVDEQAASRAAARAQKKQKKADLAAAAAAEDDGEESQVAEDEPEQAAETDPEVLKARLRRRREHKRVSGYRSKAQECGFLPSAGVAGAGGTDALMSALTIADAKRLMRFYPEVLSKSSYDKAECAARMSLSREQVPASAARETQARCEAVMRKMMNEAVLRTAEKGAMRIDAATMMAVLRPFHYLIEFSSFLPAKGLVRHAQSSGVLSATTADEEASEQEKLDNRELSNVAKKMDKDEMNRKEAFKKRKQELAEKRAAMMAAN